MYSPYLPFLSCIFTHLSLLFIKINYQLNFSLSDWANEEVEWNSQFYHAIHKQLCYIVHCIDIKLVETYWVSFYFESGRHSCIVGNSSICWWYINMIYTLNLFIYVEIIIVENKSSKQVGDGEVV